MAREDHMSGKENNGQREIALTKTQRQLIEMVNEKGRDLQAAYNETVASAYRAIEEDHGLDVGTIGTRFDASILHERFVLVEGQHVTEFPNRANN